MSGLASAISTILTKRNVLPAGIAATPNPHLILGELVNPSRIMPDRGQEGLPPAETINTFETIYFPAQRKHLARDNPRDAVGYRSSPRARVRTAWGDRSDIG